MYLLIAIFRYFDVLFNLYLTFVELFILFWFLSGILCNIKHTTPLWQICVGYWQELHDQLWCWYKHQIYNLYHLCSSLSHNTTDLITDEINVLSVCLRVMNYKYITSDMFSEQNVCISVCIYVCVCVCVCLWVFS